MKISFTSTFVNVVFVLFLYSLAKVNAMSFCNETLHRMGPKKEIIGSIENKTELTCTTEIPTCFPDNTDALYLNDVAGVTTLNSTTFNSTTFTALKKLNKIYLTNFPDLLTIEANTFTGLKNLKIIYIKYAPRLEKISILALQGLEKLSEITIEYTGILQMNGFGKLPPLISINIDSNHNLTTINSNAFSNLGNATVSIKNNVNLLKIQEFTFRDSSITNLNLNGNTGLVSIDQTAFQGAKITNLYLSNTKIRSLPTDGLQDLIKLELKNVPSLHSFPSIKQLPRLQIANLTYAYHCCALQSDYGFQTHFKPIDQILEPCDEDYSKKDYYVGYGYEEYDSGYGIPIDSPSANVTKDLCYRHPNGSLLPHITYDNVKSQLQCSPADNEFSPCENLLGHRAVSALSWLIGCLAVFGNLLVVLVFTAVAFDRKRTQQRDLSVPKFLILNLAIGDFFMGLYVLSLSVMDAKMDGQSYMYAIEWQYGGGCNFAGFIAIFSSQLSLFTLGVISLERWYAIRNAIKLDKRMSLRFAMTIMLCGWIGSMLLAILPLVGVNSYQNNILCLPMTLTNFGLGYIAFLLAIDMFAFLVVIGCYIWMYSLVRTTNGRERSFVNIFRRQRSTDETKHRDGRTDSDARVAKRMAVLVFTDFACTFPICFFALFQLAGFQLLSISTSKILLVICFPFNACLNPFLYAILTKSFRQDVHSFIRSQRHNLAGKGCKVSIRRTEKRSTNSGRQEERRNTIKYYVETSGDVALTPQTPNGNAVPTQYKASQPAKNGYSTTTFETSLSNKPCMKLSKSYNNFNNNNQKANSEDVPSKPSLHTSSSTSQNSITKRLAMFAFLRRFPLNIFRSKSKGSGPVSVEFSKHTIETHVSGHSTVEMHVSAKKDSLSIEDERISVPEPPTPETEVHSNSETFEDTES